MERFQLRQLGSQFVQLVEDRGELSSRSRGFSLFSCDPADNILSFRKINILPVDTYEPKLFDVGNDQKEGFFWVTGKCGGRDGNRCSNHPIRVDRIGAGKGLSENICSTIQCPYAIGDVPLPICRK